MTYTLWTEEKVLNAIREADKDGADLRTIGVQRGGHRKIYRAACRKFGDWKNALRKAGITYKDLEDKTIERRRQALLKNIKDAYDSGAALDCTGIKATRYKTLYWQATSLYNGRFFWENALSDAGIDPDDVVLQRRWTKEKIGTELKNRKNDGKPLNSSAIKADDGRLYKAICNHFDSHDDALVYSGLNPKRERKVRKPYSADEIVRDTIFYSLKNIRLNAKWIISENKDKKLRRLYYAAIRRFGSWEKTLTFSGIDATRHRIRKDGWKKDEILTRIKKMHEQGQPLNVGYISNSEGGLLKAARRHYGSWEKSIEASGLDYNVIRLLKPLSADEIVCEIKRLAGDGKSLDTTSMAEDSDIKVRRVYQQSWHKFEGGWEEAVEKAGFNYADISKKRRRYTNGEMADKIRELEKAGMSLKAAEMAHDPVNRKYYSAVLRRYDSWRSFLDEIGIDSSKYVSITDWNDGKTVLEYLKDMFPEGIVTGVRTKDPNLSGAALKYFGGIENATNEAGLVYSKSGKISKKMLEQNPQTTTILYKCNREFIERIAKKVYYHAISQGFKTLDRDDLISEAFLIFCDRVIKKPPKVDLRRFSYKHIYYGLINQNKKFYREIAVGDEALLDILDNLYN